MQDDPLLEQLDWFLTSLHWTTKYHATLVTAQGKPTSDHCPCVVTIQTSIPGSTSDHCPCVVTIQTSIPGSKIFRFENLWTAHAGFHKLVLDSWSKPTHKGNFAANINAKFKRLRYDLKLWSKSISKLSICIENSNRAILELDIPEDSRPLSILENNFRIIRKKHLEKLLQYQNAYWKKRCTIR
jgi:hypothetical protein